jgi:hypothetical protein
MNSKLALETESLTLLQKSKSKSKDTQQQIYYSARKKYSRQCCVIVSTVISPPRHYPAFPYLSRGLDSASLSPDQNEVRQAIKFSMERSSSAEGTDTQESLSDYAFMMEMDGTSECPV